MGREAGKAKFNKILMNTQTWLTAVQTSPFLNLAMPPSRFRRPLSLA